MLIIILAACVAYMLVQDRPISHVLWTSDQGPIFVNSFPIANCNNLDFYEQYFRKMVKQFVLYNSTF